MQEKQGTIKISSENMMPIIKKWLYSDKDIFLREIVANGVDAITKYKKLCDLGEVSANNEEKYRINVTVDQKAKTLTVEDNGIGMTADEVEKYITQIAFSGAADFLDQYEKASGDGIIGHFGLGFYSAYMVADVVEIHTKSYKDEPGVKWVSDGNSTYTITELDKKTRGTKIIMHVSKTEEEFLKENVIRALLDKYCSFMPYPVYLNPTGESENDKPMNDVAPLYLKDPKFCTDEEYKNFYRDTFADYNEPLFQIHLNMEYPFCLKGILYFPKVQKRKMQLEKGQVKLYCNQVYIADNIKEVIPEFLMLLNGVIDCPDIPLNVSRSFLQNDKQVQKISKHITKKIADKLNALYKNDRAHYEECWKDISTFIKFGCIKDEDFYEKVKDILIFKDVNGKYLTLNDCAKDELSDADAENGKLPQAVYYVSDEVQQSQYIQLFKSAGLNAIICEDFVDPHFISFIEYKNPKKCRFVRIDAETDVALKSGETDEKDYENLVGLIKSDLGNDQLTIKVEKLRNEKIPAIINVEEFMRRMSEMNGYYGMGEVDLLKNATLVLNASNKTVQSLLTLEEEKRKFVVQHIYYLALLSYKQLSAEDLGKFIEGSALLLEKYCD